MKKKLVLGVIAGITIYSVVKYNKVKDSIGKLSGKISNAKSLKIDLKKLEATFKLTYSIYNPTTETIGMDSYKLLKLTEIQFYNKSNNAFLGKSILNLSNVVIPANDFLEITDVPTQLPIENILSNLELFKENIKENLIVKLQFESLGKHFEIIA